jgi:hypothetical protein
MRLSLTKAAHTDVGGAPWQEVRVAHRFRPTYAWANIRAPIRFLQPLLRHKLLRGRLRVVQDCVAAYFQPSLRDWVLFHIQPRTSVLGYVQSVLSKLVLFERCLGSATALSLERPSPFCHPERSERICGAPFACPAPTGPQPPRIITESSWKHQPPLCHSGFPGVVPGPADPSTASRDRSASLPRISC